MPLSQISALVKSLTSCSYIFQARTAPQEEVPTHKQVTFFQCSCPLNPFLPISALSSSAQSQQTIPCTHTFPKALLRQQLSRYKLPGGSYWEETIFKEWKLSLKADSHSLQSQACVPQALYTWSPILQTLYKAPLKGNQRFTGLHFPFCPVTFFGAFSHTQESPEEPCRWTVMISWPSHS